MKAPELEDNSGQNIITIMDMVEMTCPVLGCDMGKVALYKTESVHVTTATTLLNEHFTSGQPTAV